MRSIFRDEVPTTVFVQKQLSKGTFPTAINEDSVMSIMHRLLPSAVGYQSRKNFIKAQNPSKEANLQPTGATLRLTCAPWSGLYLEDPELS